MRVGESETEFSRAPTKSRKMWTKVEEDLLLQAVSIQSAPDEDSIQWSSVAKLVPGRAPKSCRDRYWNHVRSGVASRGQGWTLEDDKLLLEKVAELGPQLTVIARFFPSRRPSEVKNRYYNHLSRGSGFGSEEGDCPASDAEAPQIAAPDPRPRTGSKPEPTPELSTTIELDFGWSGEFDIFECDWNSPEFICGI
jgi:hypothetical protein